MRCEERFFVSPGLTVHGHQPAMSYVGHHVFGRLIVICVCSGRAVAALRARSADRHGASGRSFMIIGGVSSQEEMCLVVESGDACFQRSVAFF